MEQWEVNAYLSDIELNIKNGNTETALDGLNTLSVKLGGGEQIPCANAGLCSVAGPEVRAGLQDAELKVFLLRKMEEYNYTFRNTDDEDRRYKAFISYKALEKFLKDAKKANFIK